MSRPPQIRRRTANLYDRAALGTYHGPARTTEPPKATPYRLTLLRAIAAGEIRAGQGQYVNAWRWQGSTVTKHVTLLIRCGWAKPAAAHVELTPAGQAVLDGAA